MGVPRRTSERLLLALAIHPAEANDLSALTNNGWELVDPAAVAATPDDYRAFIHASKAEFGIAKSGYVVSRSRMVQRPQRLLPGVRPSGPRPGHRTFGDHPDRLRAGHLFDAGRSDCRDRGDQPQLRRSLQGGARTGRVVLRFEVTC